MPLDFDLVNFIEDMRACKPPYKCPIKECNKPFKTFSGIEKHLHKDHVNTKGVLNGHRTPPRSPSPQPFYRSPLKETLVFHDLSRHLTFEAEGRTHKLMAVDSLLLVDCHKWEASVPKEMRERALKDAQEESDRQPKTPQTAKKKKKGLKTPKPDADGHTENEGLLAPPGEKKMLKLPEALFHTLDDYDLPDAPPLPNSYIRFIEKPAEEQDEEVEYDMDEEDVAWLDIINEKRATDGFANITEDDFELLMDRLEKESYFHVQTNGKDYSAPIDDDAICCVCMDGECSNTNVILFCDLCNLAVHQECYGVPYIPEGQWLCRRCLQSPSRSVDCCLCPNKGGAFKQTDDGRWAHVVCGLWIPEVRFANTVFLEPIDSIDNIPPARWKLSCRVCKQRGVGACIQCHKTNCYTAFHVTCGLLAGLHMKMDTVRESSASGLSVTVRKTAYCDVHTPHDSDCKPKLDDVASLGISTPKLKSKSPKKPVDQSPVPVLFRGLMNFSPQCPWEKVQEIASLINVQKKNQFFQRLMAYWTLKRQTRNGVPLIRRLQFAKAMRPDKKPETPQKNAHHSQKKKEAQRAIAQQALEDFKDMQWERRLMRRLRQDLERVRLLCELIRKREQRKRELMQNRLEIIQMQCWPFLFFMRDVMDNLQTIDTQEIFTEPVSMEDVPDYYDHIKKPMDFLTMWDKLDNFQYPTIDAMEVDFVVMVQNCLSYNERDTVFFRAGVKMRDLGGSLIRQARRQIERIGYDPDTGMHTTEQKAPVNVNVSDDKLMKEIDNFINTEDGHEDMTDEEQLNVLLELQDKAGTLHHPVAKSKRLKLLKQEITKTRRKISLEKSPGPGMVRMKQQLQQESEEAAAAAALVVTSTPKEKKSGKKMARDPSPEGVITPGGRRLRAGKEITAADEKETPKSGKKGGPGRKRQRAPSSDSVEAEEPNSKKAKGSGDADTPVMKTPVKLGILSSSSPAKSPAGVNRRNAVLFTRKKNQAPPPASADDEDEEVIVSSPKKKVNAEELVLAEQELEVQSPAPVSCPLSPAEGTSSQEADDKTKKSKDSPAKKVKKKRGRKPKSTSISSTVNVGGPALGDDDDEDDDEPVRPLPSLIKSDDTWKPRASTAASFQQYRRGGDVGETDDDTMSESATDALGTSEDDSLDDSDSDDSSMNTASALTIQLEPLDLVWAKCRGYPWYPALIINPKMPRTGYLHNGVPIPVPPGEVLDMTSTHATPHYLILFFDAKRTWQWLQRDKLEPLGVDSEMDKAKLMQSKKPSERKAVKKAYEEAILHRCKVTGENASASEESSEEQPTDEDKKEEKKSQKE